MTDTNRFTWKDAFLLAAILAVAAGTRAGYLMGCADYGRNAGPLRVETPLPELDHLLAGLKQQRFALPTGMDGSDEDTAAVSPGYPVLMAGVNRLIEDAALPSAMRWLQCGLGAVTAGLYFLFARRAFDNTLAALLAGLLCALHPFWIVDVAVLADGVLASFLLALALFLGARAGQTTGPLASLLYGLVLAALALVRAALLPFTFVALAWFLWRSRTLPRGWLASLLAFLGFINGLAPWTIRNWQIYGEPVPIVDSAYYHLWVGNRPPAAEGSNENAPSKLPTRIERDREYSQQIRREMADHPAETVHRRLRAGVDFLFGQRWFQANRLAESTESAAPDWLAGSYSVILESTLLGMLFLGLLGWRWTYGWRSSAMPSSLAMIWIPLPYVLSHAGALSGARLPLDGVLLSYAAFALACLLPGNSRLWQGEPSLSSETQA
jgi:4-amino-4-deoxy-L-arabinose transferase-like glycosyltransferase